MTRTDKNELYGSLTTKELKKKHSSRPEGGAERGSIMDRTHGKGLLMELAVPHLQTKWEEKLGNDIDHSTHGYSAGK